MERRSGTVETPKNGPQCKAQKKPTGAGSSSSPQNTPLPRKSGISRPIPSGPSVGPELAPFPHKKNRVLQTLHVTVEEEEEEVGHQAKKKMVLVHPTGFCWEDGSKTIERGGGRGGRVRTVGHHGAGLAPSTDHCPPAPSSGPRRGTAGGRAGPSHRRVETGCEPAPLADHSPPGQLGIPLAKILD